jgi:SAM-dependent methyltransferase
MADKAIEEAVREHYAMAARTASCCSDASTVVPDDEVYGAACYEGSDLEGLPTEAVTASIGCANPVALADLHPGEDVLDLGSGGGIDVLLSARRVGSSGKAYGVDMTDEMLELARANQSRAGLQNVEFLKGRIEDVPLADDSVDVIISNCVVNLSGDKGAVFAEALRLLRPGGRLAVADVVADHEVSAELASNMSAWVDCLGGALTIRNSHAAADGFTSALITARKPMV